MLLRASIVVATTCLAWSVAAFAADGVPLTGIARIAAGGMHACAVTAAGRIQCWGANGEGQLGDGTTTSSRVAVGVSLAGNATSVSAGDAHTCAVTSVGGVTCWGWNGAGQLGNGTTTSSSVPVDVAGLASGVVAVAAAYDHTCALTSAGGVKCWGSNAYGQLGSPINGGSLVPVDVSGLASGVLAISAAGSSSFYYGAHTCALTAGGGMKCWGWNGRGQLGTGTTATSSTPVDVSGMHAGVTSIATGVGYSCAIVGAGAKCWGSNTYAQVGDGTAGDRLLPVDVAGLGSGVAAIAGGRFHACARRLDGGMVCWGSNIAGEVGDGTTGFSAPTPRTVTAVAAGTTAMSLGGNFTCVQVPDGGARCWGDNVQGALGNGIPVDFPVPGEVAGLPAGSAKVSAGNDVTCILTASGGVKCWGGSDAHVPADVPGLTGVVGLDTAKGWLGGHRCAATAAGAAKCWGSNDYGQLGDGTTTSSQTPVAVAGLTSGVVAIATGEGHSCALTGAGGVLCWGRGFLGNGSMDGSLVPVGVTGMSSGITSIAAGAAHTCAVSGTGGVKCWGANGSGQLGDNTRTDALVPVDVTGLASGVVAVAAAYHHTCALSSGGALKCWGGNFDGQLGDGSRIDRLTPAGVSGLASGVLAVTAGGPVQWIGGSHTCALMSGGGVKCWGSNDHGQLGDATTADAPAPADVLTLGAAATAVSAGTGHTCAIMAVDGVKCWGANRVGQLGNGTAGYFTSGQVVLTAACEGFVDVAPTSAFCASVRWIRNRAITVGCTSELYCPDAAVSRLAMAAFLRRFGDALQPTSTMREEASGALDLDAAPVVCATGDAAAVSWPRRAAIDALLAATSSGAAVEASIVASADGGTTWQALATLAPRVMVTGGRWANVRTLARVDVDAGQVLRFGLRVVRPATAAPGTLTDSVCRLRVTLGNRN